MRLLHHGGQVLLLLVVGALAGAVAGGVALERSGLPAPVANRAASLLAPARSSLPPRIQIAGRAPLASTAASSPGAAQPTPTTAVVPNVVYTYPPESHGGGGAGSGGSGPSGGPGPSGGGGGGGGHRGHA